MKLNFKKLGIEAEGDVENLVKKAMDNHEKDWKEKFETKHNAKKEVMELKHKYKQEKTQKIGYLKDLLSYEKEIEKQKIKNKEKHSQKSILIIDIILFFIFGIFCIQGLKDNHTIAGIISLIQILLVTTSIFTSMEVFKIFKNDSKVFLLLSILSIIPWLAFSI